MARSRQNWRASLSKISGSFFPIQPLKQTNQAFFPRYIIKLPPPTKSFFFSRNREKSVSFQGYRGTSRALSALIRAWFFSGRQAGRGEETWWHAGSRLFFGSILLRRSHRWSRHEPSANRNYPTEARDTPWKTSDFSGIARYSCIIHTCSGLPRWID